jgi:hypothetical protein
MASILVSVVLRPALIAPAILVFAPSLLAQPQPNPPPFSKPLTPSQRRAVEDAVSKAWELALPGPGFPFPDPDESWDPLDPRLDGLKNLTDGLSSGSITIWTGPTSQTGLAETVPNGENSDRIEAAPVVGPPITWIRVRQVAA